MSMGSPKKNDVNFPPLASVKIRNAAGNETYDPGENIPVQKLMKMIVAALRILNNKKGSTVAEIKRLLCSERGLNSSVDLRPAIILALKKGKIMRPSEAVKAGIYGMYVLTIDDNEIGMYYLKKNTQKKPRKQSKTGKKNVA